MKGRKVTFGEGILGILTYYNGGSRIVYDYVSGRTVPDTRARKFVMHDTAVSRKSFNTTLYRLKKQGLISQKDGVWSISHSGKVYLQDLLKKAKEALPAHSIQTSTSQKLKKQMIISFDIPESHRKVRQWLRIELRYLGFELLQKSVWIGPAPLPESFISSLQTLDILPYMKFFNASEADIV